MNHRQSHLLSFFLIAAFIVAIFLPILSFGWMGIEDPSYYQTNPLFGQSPLLNRLIAAWTNSPESNYIPLTWNVTILLAHLTQGSPLAFHILSLVLHLSCSLVAFLLLRRFGFENKAATFVVLLFALHPLRVESIAWASSIKGLLAAFFALGALFIQSSPQLKFRSTLIVLLFLCSLLSKQTLLLLPAVFFLISASNPEFRLKNLTYLPLVILTLLAAFVASRANSGNTLTAINQFYDGYFTPLKALAAYGHYLKQQIIPWPLFPEYPSTQTLPLIILGLVGLIPIVLLVKDLALSKRPPFSLLFFTAVFVFLAPVLGLIPTPLEFAVDRLTYLPSLFFWAAFASLIQERVPSFRVHPICNIFPALVLILFTWLTTRQIPVWKNTDSLTKHILQAQPDHYLANLTVANQLGGQGQFKDALPYAKTLIQDHPLQYGGWKTFSEVTRQLGQTPSTLQKLDHALTQPTPIAGDLHLLRCDSLRTLGRFQEALASCEQARNNGIDDLTIHYYRARVFLVANLLAKAENETNKALALSPHSPEAKELKENISQQKAAQF